PNPGRVAYCAAKAAVLMMTRVAAGEWAGRGVRVNAIAPGIQRTPMWDADVARGAIDEAFYPRTVPMGRIGEPREVGKLAVYLCSDDAAYVTGGCFTIDGGLTSIPAGSRGRCRYEARAQASGACYPRSDGWLVQAGVPATTARGARPSGGPRRAS